MLHRRYLAANIELVKHPDRELRARAHNPEDPNSTSYRVYLRGRLRGAILPIEEDADGARWEAIARDGAVTRWRYRNQARDFLCDEPDETNEPAGTRPTPRFSNEVQQESG